MGKPTSHDRLVKDLEQLVSALSDCEAGRLPGLLDGERDEMAALLKQRILDVEAQLASLAGLTSAANIARTE